MESSHSISSGSAHQNDSWTCHRCGWVYPNAHPSAKHRRNHKKQCGKIKGFELRSEHHNGGSSDEASSDDENHVKEESLQTPPKTVEKQLSTDLEEQKLVDIAGDGSQSRDFHVVGGANASDRVITDMPVPHGMLSSSDVKTEDASHESTLSIISKDVLESENPAAELIQNVVSSGKPYASPEELIAEEKGDVAALVSHGLVPYQAEEFPKQDVKLENPSAKVTRDITFLEEPLKTQVEQGKVSHVVDKAEVIMLDSEPNQAKTVHKQEINSVAFSPEHVQNTAPVNEPVNGLREEGKASLASLVEKAEITAPESQGLDSDQAKQSHKDEKVNVLVNPGSSHHDHDDSWTCHRCGWVYPNPHPSAKHRRNHKKHCGKIKGFELRSEHHKGGSSDEASSDEETSDKKDSLVPKSPQLMQTGEQANSQAAPVNSINIDIAAGSAQEKISTESGSDNIKTKDLFESKSNAPDGAMPVLPDLPTPDVKLEDTVCGLQQNIASSVPAEEKEIGAARLDEIEVVAPDLSGQGTDQQAKVPVIQDPEIFVAVSGAIAPSPTGFAKDGLHGQVNKAGNDIKHDEVQLSLSEGQGASTPNVDKSSAVGLHVTDAMKFDNETLAESREARLQTVTVKDPDVSAKSGLELNSECKNLEMSEGRLVDGPSSKQMVETVLEGLDGKDGGLPLDKFSSIISLESNEIPVEKETLTQSVLPSTSSVTVVSAHKLSPVGTGSKDDASGETEEIPSDTTMQGQSSHSSIDEGTLEKTATTEKALSVGKEETVNLMAEAEVLKEAIIPVDSFQESKSMEKSLETPEVPKAELTEAAGSSVQDFGTANEAEAGGASSTKDVDLDTSAINMPEAKEDDALCETRDGRLFSPSSTEKNVDTKLSTGSALIRGEVGASSHKLSDSLEIYEDAADTLETCSVEENEMSDELRQTVDGTLEETKHLGDASLDKEMLNVSVGLENMVSVLDLDNASVGKVTSEQKVASPVVTYATKSETPVLRAPSPEAWQEAAGPSNVKAQGKSSSSEVTEDGKSGDSHTALRSLMAKEGVVKADQAVGTSVIAGDSNSLNKTEGLLGSSNNTKPKSRSFWSHCLCCPTVH